MFKDGWDGWEHTWIYTAGKIIDSIVLFLFVLGLIGLAIKTKFKIDTSALIIFGIQLICTILKVLTDY